MTNFLDLKAGDCLPADFKEKIPEKIYQLIIDIRQEGFILTLVGGAVRDYLKFGTLSRDMDFEIRHQYEYEEEEWTSRLNRLGKRLHEIYHYHVEFLSFNIMRIKVRDMYVEVAPPREEIFEEGDVFGHSDFKARLYSNQPVEKCWLRRDFTINAIGIQFCEPNSELEFKLIDPFGGVDDLKKGILKHCGPNFFKDPVRFLRMIRFRQKFDMSLSDELIKGLQQFNLSELTAFYLFREAFKSRFLPFIKEFFTLAEKHGINLPQGLQQLSYFKDFERDNLDLHTIDEVMLFLVYQDTPPTEHQLYDFQYYANLKESMIKSHITFRQILERLDDVQEDKLKSEVEELTLKEFLNLEDVYLIKTFHQFVAKHEHEKLSKLGAINSTLYKNYLRVTDIIPRQLEGKELFEQMLTDKSIPVEKRGELLVYCHLKSKWGIN